MLVLRGGKHGALRMVNSSRKNDKRRGIIDRGFLVMPLLEDAHAETDTCESQSTGQYICRTCNPLATCDRQHRVGW